MFLDISLISKCQLLYSDFNADLMKTTVLRPGEQEKRATQGL